MKIIGSLPNLRRVELDLLKPSVAERYLPHLLRLRHLDAIHLDGFHTFNVDHFKQITETATVLTEFSFPKGTPWAEREYLTILKQTYIRTIQPWSYIGGAGEGQKYSLLINVLTQLTDLTEVHIYMGHFIHSPPNAQSPHIDQTDQFIKVMATLSTQTAVTNLVIALQDLKFEIDGNAISEGISHVQSTLTDFGLLAGFQQRSFFHSRDDRIESPEDFSMIYHQLSKVPQLRSIHLSGVTKADIGEILDNCPLTAIHIEMEGVEEFIGHLSKDSFQGLEDFSLSVPGTDLREGDTSMILAAVQRLAPSLRKLKLAGAWVDSAFVSALPGMPLLQSLAFMPPHTRIMETLQTEDVLQFSLRCPQLVEPRFLRYPKMLSTIAISEAAPGAEVDENGCGSTHPDWRVYSQTEHSA